MSYILKTPDDILRAINDDKIEKIDLRFTSLSGQWHSFSVPPSTVDLDSIEHGVGLDEASILGFRKIEASETRAIPAPASAFLDPFAQMPTLVLICNIHDLTSGHSHSHDPRYIAQKAEAYLQTTQIGDTANFGLELEYFIFEGARKGHLENSLLVEMNRTAAERRSRASRGAKLRRNEAHLPVPPMKAHQSVRAEMIATFAKLGIKVAARRQDIAPDGRGTIDMHFKSLTRMADNVMIIKYVVENVASRNGMMATFMPQHLIGENSVGMRIHQSIWQGEQPLFAGDGYAGTSALMRHYIAGLVEHAPALLAICAPTAHSPRRPERGQNRLVDLGHAQRDAAQSSIQIYSPDRKATRVEFRCPDPSCNPYLTFAAMLMAGIDGFHNRFYNVDREEPIETFYDQRTQQQRVNGLSARATPENSLDALAADQDFLLRGDVFTRDVIEAYLSYKPRR
jgi:glutamine synthetase